MTDQPATSSIIPQPIAELSPEQAAERRTALMGDPEWRSRYLGGGVRERLEFDELHRKLAPVESEARAAREQDHLIATLQAFADIPESVVAQIKAGQPVSADERRLALQTKQRLMRDRDWVRRYLEGGVIERRQMTLCSIIEASPVK